MMSSAAPECFTEHGLNIDTVHLSHSGETATKKGRTSGRDLPFKR